MILQCFLAALNQLGDPRFQRVLWLGLGLTVGLLIGIYLLFLGAIGLFVPDQITLPWWGPVSGIDRALSWGAIPLVLLLSVFLMVPVASAFSGFFLDDVAEAVEERHYPQVAVPPRVPFLTALLDSVSFFGVIVVVNLLALILYLFAGPFIPLVFWAVNGYLLGREYFTLAAMRHLGRDGARALRRRNAGTLWLAGVLMAAPLSIPLVNLVVPVLGAATFTHLFHRLQGQAPSRR
jgi:CysZ protein